MQITDQPSERPDDGPPTDRSRHVILTLSSPLPSDAAATIPIVTAIFTLIDLLDAKLPLRPETKAKLKARREEVDEELRKEAAKERIEEQEDNKRTAKRKAEEEKVSKLSPAEQKKVSSVLESDFFIPYQDRPRSSRKRSAKGLYGNSKGKWYLVKDNIFVVLVGI